MVLRPELSIAEAPTTTNGFGGGVDWTREGCDDDDL